MSAPFQSSQEFYAYLDTVVADLRNAGFAHEADAIDFRLHRVAWTTSTELFDELEERLRALTLAGLPAAVNAKVHRCLTTLEAR